MLAQTKERGWYWFCEQELPNGKPCKAINMRPKDREQALKEYADHIKDVEHKD
jgi:hypothetical protein